jgi:hypothetical protein
MSNIYWSWSNIPGSLKRIRQNITRGWNDSDCWNLQTTTSNFIIPRLKRLKEIVHGYPSMLIDNEEDNYDDGMKKWKEILDKIIYAFEVVSKDYDHISIKDAGGKLEFIPCDDRPEYSTLEYIGTEEQKKLHNQYVNEYHKAIEDERIKVQEGLQLFAKYYECLWD